MNPARIATDTMTLTAVAIVATSVTASPKSALVSEGRPQPADVQPPASFINYIGHDYFDVMGIPIVRGRAFTAEDEHEHSTSRRYAIVNEAFAETHWPGQDPIGRRFRAYNLTDPPLEVVGVARDSKYVVVFESRRPYVYLPVVRDMTLRTVIVRATGDPTTLAPRLEREVGLLDPAMPVADLRTMTQTLRGVFGFLVFRIGAIQAGGAGLLGLALAIVGVYGVVSFGAGLLVSIAMSSVLSRFLPLVDAGDWMTFAAVAAGLAVLALIACHVPARRATRVPVMTALRYE
jgi:hypothetical protein